MELLLDMSSQMIAMEKFLTQREQADRDQNRRDDAVRRISPQLAARHDKRSLETTQTEEESHVPETVRKKLAE